VNGDYTARELIEAYESGNNSLPAKFTSQTTPAMLANRLDCPKGYHMVVYRNEESYWAFMEDLLEVLDEMNISYEWYERARRLKLESGAYVVQNHIRDFESRPCMRMCGLTFTTAIVLDFYLQDPQDIDYMVSRLRSESSYPSEMWIPRCQGYNTMCEPHFPKPS
jgi:hypothetical protein